MKGIYRIVNRKNNKCYVGRTINFSQRKRGHFNLLKNGKHYSAAMQKDFVAEDFYFEILENCSDEDLIKLEEFYIEKYNSVINGYNLLYKNGSLKSLGLLIK
jgi:group I intron endonuclease